MSNSDDDLLIGTITIHRYLTTDGSDDYITLSAYDTAGETLRIVESLGMIELARIQLTSDHLGLDYDEDVDE